MKTADPAVIVPIPISFLWPRPPKYSFSENSRSVESGEAPVVEVTEFLARGPALLTFAYPAALAEGTWLVEVQRTDANGTTHRSASVEVNA